ncbi:MAG: TldD/PmbA family protein [bacterium]
MDSISIAKKLLGLIEKSAADAGEVFLRTSEGVDVEVRDQAVESVRNTQAAGYGLRLVVDRRMAFVSSSDMRDRSLETAVAKAADLARHSTADDSNVFIAPSGEGASVETFDESFDSITIDQKVNLLKDVETLCFAFDPVISKMEGINYSDRKTETVIANTEGLLSKRRATSFEFGAGVMAEKDGEVENGWEGMEARFFDRLDTPSEIASSACRKAISRLGAKPVATQSVPVIVDRAVAYAVLSHFFQMVSGERIANGTSMLKGRIGEKIGSDLVTIVDDPTLPGLPGSRSFDDEGTPSGRNVLLDRGVLKGFLYDVSSASKTGAESTGNASRRGFRDLPGIATTNFFMARGGLDPEDIVKRTGTGLHVTSLAGWWTGINPTTGDFSSGAKGFWIEDGVAVHPVKNVTIASNLLSMLAGVDALGNNLFHRFGTVGPTFRISEMKVGGA